MQLEHVELLQIQRDLHDIPRGMGRFQEYLRVMTGGTGDILLPPLNIMNPMGREHVAEQLGQLIAMGAEQIAAKAVRQTEAQLTHLEGKLRHGFGIADDLHGGWTNRYSSEASFHFTNDAALKRGWVGTILWVSDTPNSDHIYQEVVRSIYRATEIQQHGLAKSLQQLMRQEGRAAVSAGIFPHLDDEEIAYSREIIQPYLQSTSYPIWFAAMYGDKAAATFGYTQLGLSPRAGFALAIADYLLLRK